MLVSMGLAVVYLVLEAPAIVQRIERDVGGPRFRWLLVGCVLGVGTVIHVFKRINQLWYGITEIIFGAATMYRVAETWPQGGTMATQWVAVIAGAYIVARGLNNCQEARIKSGSAL
jgi:hypothetical protein